MKTRTRRILSKTNRLLRRVQGFQILHDSKSFFQNIYKHNTLKSDFKRSKVLCVTIFGTSFVYGVLKDGSITATLLLILINSYSPTVVIRGRQNHSVLQTFYLKNSRELDIKVQIILRKRKFPTICQNLSFLRPS